METKISFTEISTEVLVSVSDTVGIHFENWHQISTRTTVEYKHHFVSYHSPMIAMSCVNRASLSGLYATRLYSVAGMGTSPSIAV